MILALAAAACSSSTSVLEKPAPQAVTADSLIHPPWEALVKAGPGAEKDIDLETLNGPQTANLPAPPAPADGALAPQQPAPGTPSTAAPAPEAKAAEKPAAAPKGKPVTIKAVAVLAVTGASAQGDAELTAAMRAVLKKAGWPVLAAPRKDALNIQGKVVLDAAQGASQMVHVTWVVTSPSAKVLGNVAQNNAVPAHSLDGSWGPSAGYAAEAAAEGIFKLIGQFR
ncbi:MAG: hypothetical protein KGO53_13005 [Alphaproteobacteria bacterium]|nr:hypothetical protein [Alphaproteobacteria bacterium]